MIFQKLLKTIFRISLNTGNTTGDRPNFVFMSKNIPSFYLLYAASIAVRVSCSLFYIRSAMV